MSNNDEEDDHRSKIDDNYEDDDNLTSFNNKYNVANNDKEYDHRTILDDKYDEDYNVTSFNNNERGDNVTSFNNNEGDDDLTSVNDDEVDHNVNTVDDDDEVDDYLSMSIDEPVGSKTPETSLQRSARLKREAFERGHPPSKREIAAKAAESRKRGLDTPLDLNNKGAKLMAKMGYKGSALGVPGNLGIEEPVGFVLKSDRRGIGMPPETRAERMARFAAESQENKQSIGRAMAEDYRKRCYEEARAKHNEQNWYNAMKTLEGLEDTLNAAQIAASAAVASAVIDLENPQAAADNPKEARAVIAFNLATAKTAADNPEEARAAAAAAVNLDTAQTAADDPEEARAVAAVKLYIALTADTQAEGPYPGTGTKEAPLHKINIFYRPLVKQRRDAEQKKLDRKSMFDRQPGLGFHGLGYNDEPALVDQSYDDIAVADPELEKYEALPPARKLDLVLRHLRLTYKYCHWCKYQYEDSVLYGCPGLYEDQHD